VKLIAPQLLTHPPAGRELPGFVDAVLELPLNVRDDVAGVMAWLPDLSASTLRLLQGTARDLAAQGERRAWFRVVAERTGLCLRVPQCNRAA